MNRPGRILIVDDEEDFRKTLVEFLRQHDFTADAVENVSQAKERLSKDIYHIVVLDINLQNKAGNEEGIELLKELKKSSLNEATKVIMLSAYGTLANMRQAFKDYEVADFLSKDNFSPQIFLDSVKQVFTEKVMINLALDIQWQQLQRPEEVLLNLEVNGKRIGRRQSSASRKHLFDELEDLFCRLFYKAEMILVRPLTPGWSGAKVLLVQPFYHNQGPGKDLIMKLGDVKKIRKEHDNFRKYVENLLRGARSTTILDQRYTLHLGGIVYSLMGTGNEPLVDFAHFYHSTDDVSKIIDVLKHLFLETCVSWYDNPSSKKLCDLAADYRQYYNYLPRQIERILATHLQSVDVQEQMTFTSLNAARRFTNPLAPAMKLSLKRYISTCIMHGDFNPYNLFIDRAGFTWMIDFQWTEEGHMLRDFAMLDSAIRFQLLRGQDATLEELLQMEEALCKADRFSQLPQATSFTTGNWALEKAYTTIINLRELAGTLVAHDPYSDMSEYYVALLYNALYTLHFSSLEAAQHEHALLCASLLADKLILGNLQQR